MTTTPCGGSPPRWTTPSRTSPRWPRPSSSAAPGDRCGSSSIPLLLAARNLTATELVPRLQQANRQSYSGTLQALNQEILLQTGTFLPRPRRSAASWLACTAANRSICDEVASVIDGPEEPTSYVLFGHGKGQPEEAAVTLSLAKRPGANAVQVVETVLAKVDTLKGTLIPTDVDGERHPQLRRNRGGKIQRAAAAHGHRRLRRGPAHPLFPGLARVDHRHARHPLDPGADPAGLLPLRLHPEPHHPLRPDLFHRHPGG